MENQRDKQKKNEELVQITKWQNKLLPWFILMPTALIAVFIFLASQQLVRFNKALEAKPDSLLIGNILPNPGSIKISDDIINSEQYLRWITLTRMEQESLYRRYNQGGLLLMSRIYTKYLGFFTGMIMAIVGAVFIIGKIREDKSEISGTANELIKFSIVSSSPGIIFGVLGTVLMLATILNHNEILIQDTPLYLNQKTIMSSEILELLKKNSSDSVNIDKLSDEAVKMWETDANNETNKTP